MPNDNNVEEIMNKQISRRDFLKLAGATALTVAIGDKIPLNEQSPIETELLPYEQEQGVLSTHNMPISLFPVRADYFYSYWKDPQHTNPATVDEICVSDLELGYRNLFYYTDPSTGYSSRYTIFPHTTGMKAIAIGLLDTGHIDNSGNYHVDTAFYTDKSRSPDQSTTSGQEHSIFANFYPNKIINVLEAMKAIDDYQQSNQGFKAGQEYSMLDILNIQGRSGYVSGYNSSRDFVKGGGVCITATNMCKLQTLLGATITERWQHPTNSRYSSSPFAGETLTAANSDATVQLGENGSQNYDFKWVAPQNGFIKLTANLIPNGNNVQSDMGDRDTTGIDSDTSIIATFKFSPTNPGEQSSNLSLLQDAYKNFRRDRTFSLNQNGNIASEIQWQEGDDTTQFLKSIAPEERISHFQTEMERDPFVSCIFQIKEIMDNYNSNQNIRVGDYLQQTRWYTQQIERLGENTSERDSFEAALRHLNQNTNVVLGQPMQCVGFAVLLAGLNFQGYSFKNIGGTGVSSAAQLVPEDIRNGNSSSAWQNGMNIRTITTREEISVGDLFVLYNNEVGHIGGVIGKKIVNGNTILLFAAANQTSNGKIKIFEVDGNNFDVVIGPDPYKKVIIR